MYKQSLILYFKNFMLRRHLVIELTRFQLVNAKNLPNSFANRKWVGKKADKSLFGFPRQEKIYVKNLLPAYLFSLMLNCQLTYFLKGTGTRDLIWLKVVSLERSWWVGLTEARYNFTIGWRIVQIGWQIVQIGWRIVNSQKQSYSHLQ